MRLSVVLVTLTLFWGADGAAGAGGAGAGGASASLLRGAGGAGGAGAGSASTSAHHDGAASDALVVLESGAYNVCRTNRCRVRLHASGRQVALAMGCILPLKSFVQVHSLAAHDYYCVTILQMMTCCVSRRSSRHTRPRPPVYWNYACSAAASRNSRPRLLHLYDNAHCVNDRESVLLLTYGLTSGAPWARDGIEQGCFQPQQYALARILLHTRCPCIEVRCRARYALQHGRLGLSLELAP